MAGEQRSETLAEELDQLYGVAIDPGGVIAVAELGCGRVLLVNDARAEELASGLQAPKGVASGPDGDCYVAEAGAGRIVKLARGGSETVIDRLGHPEGIPSAGETLWVLDAQTREVMYCSLANGERTVLAAGLPVGPPPGVEPKPLGAIADDGRSHRPVRRPRLRPRRPHLPIRRWRMGCHAPAA